MAMPKGYMTNIDITPSKIGPERRQEILDGITDKGTFLPRGVLEEDMDEAVIEALKTDDRFYMSLEGERIPVIFLTIQRWTEFTKTWEFTDEYKNIKMPFITVVRNPDIQQGQNQAGLWNIPGNRTYTMVKVPTWDGARRGVDMYKIPQPTSVDLTYEVRIFATKLRHLNKFNRLMQRAFQSRQCYIDVKGHPMPLHLENIGDESNIDDFENKRFYVQLFELKLLGYLLDEEEYEVVPSINRTLVAMEIDETKLYNDIIFDSTNKNNEANFTFLFKPRAKNEFEFILKYDVNFTVLTEISNISRIVIKANGIGIFDGTVLNSPLILSANDVIKIRVYKNNLTQGSFKLLGTTTTT